MPWTIILAVWVIFGIYGLMNKAWRKHAKREKAALYSLLGITMILSIGLALNPKLPGLTEWVSALYKPVEGILSPN
jgi:hypothetical protein